MKSFMFLVLTALFIASAIALELGLPRKIVCFWNSTILDRQMPNQFEIDDLRPALSYCTHLIYGYAEINVENHEVIVQYPNIDTDAGHFLYRLITQIKRNFLDLKIYLSIGGNDDPYEKTHEYLTLIETTESQTKFINSVHQLLSVYNFDGIDFAWPFPTVKIQKTHGKFGSIWHGIKKIFGHSVIKEMKTVPHGHSFTQLVTALRVDPRFSLKDLTLTVLPRVNVTAYYEPRLLAPNIEAVHLMAFDAITPKTNHEKADFPAPINNSYDHILADHGDPHATYWLENGTPSEKIVVGIPKRVSCVVDITKKFENYVHLSYNPTTKNNGIWISHEIVESAKIKAYARNNSLGGIAIFDLSYADFKGTCTENKFPIVLDVEFKL